MTTGVAARAGHNEGREYDRRELDVDRPSARDLRVNDAGPLRIMRDYSRDDRSGGDPCAKTG